MDRLLSPETFEFLARYFLAGWVFLSVRSWWVRGERPKPNEVLFEAVTLSLINQLLSLVTVPLIISKIVAIGSTPSLIAEVLIQPALVGLLIGWLADHDWIPPGLRRLFMPSVQTVTGSFDFAFDQLTGPAYLILTFDSGHTIYAYFGKDSLAGSDQKPEDIYVESVFQLDEDDVWIDTGRAAWVSLKDIKSIEFIPEEDA